MATIARSCGADSGNATTHGTCLTAVSPSVSNGFFARASVTMQCAGNAARSRFSTLMVFVTAKESAKPPRSLIAALAADAAHFNGIRCGFEAHVASSLCDSAFDLFVFELHD